jgi:hypothetical protein
VDVFEIVRHGRCSADVELRGRAATASRFA